MYNELKLNNFSNSFFLKIPITFNDIKHFSPNYQRDNKLIMITKLSPTNF